MPDRRKVIAIGVYAVGVGFVGGTVGLLVGLSQSPVVATVMPLVFALIGGVGLLLPWLRTAGAQGAAPAAQNPPPAQPNPAPAQPNPIPAQQPPASSPAPWSHVLSYIVVGSALVAFSIGATVGVFYGMLMRSDSTWSELFPHRSILDNAAFDGLNPAEAADLAILAKVLEQMGSDFEARSALLASLTTAESCLSVYAPLLAAVRAIPTTDAPVAFQQLALNVTALEDAVDVATLRATLSLIADYSAELLFTVEDHQWLLQHPQVGAALRPMIENVLRIHNCSAPSAALERLFSRLDRLAEVAAGITLLSAGDGMWVETPR